MFTVAGWIYAVLRRLPFAWSSVVGSGLRECVPIDADEFEREMADDEGRHYAIPGIRRVIPPDHQR